MMLSRKLENKNMVLHIVLGLLLLWRNTKTKQDGEEGVI